MGTSKNLLPSLEGLDDRIWSIVGSFNNDGIDFTFGGWFTQDTFLGGNVTGGRLVDSDGSSRILPGGRFIPEEVLEFTKKYNQAGQKINYTFHKEGDLWVGEYQNAKYNHHGPAGCVIQPVTKL